MPSALLIGVEREDDLKGRRRPPVYSIGIVVLLLAALSVVFATWQPTRVAERTEATPEAATPPVVVAGLASQVPGFGSTLVAAVQNGTAEYVVVWKPDEAAVTRRIPDGMVLLDVDGRGRALLLHDGDRLRVETDGGAIRLDGVTGAFWDGDRPGHFAYTARVDGEHVVAAFSPEEGFAPDIRIPDRARLRAWGSWGYALQEGPSLLMLAPDGTRHVSTWRRLGLLDAGPEGRLIARTGRGEIVFADPALGAVINLSWVPDEVTQARWSPTGRLVALQTGNQRGGTQFEVWAMTGERALSVPGEPDSLLAFSHDERHLVIGRGDAVHVVAIDGGLSRIVELGGLITSVRLGGPD